jgi:hypothetical protein
MRLKSRFIGTGVTSGLTLSADDRTCSDVGRARRAGGRGASTGGATVGFWTLNVSKAAALWVEAAPGCWSL